MSKKIAQLTKVIFHLHTKNEENKSFKQAVTNAYEKEVNIILQDCNNTIAKYKEALDKQTSNANAKTLVEDLQRKHDAEKALSIKEFEEFKRKTTQRENELNMNH